MTLTEKKQALAALVKQARGYLDAGDMDAYAKADADIDKAEKEIDALEKQEKREAALAAIPDPAHSRPQPQDNAPKGKLTASAEYKDAFFRAVRGGKSAITAEDRKLFSNVMSTGTDASGGFLVVPEEMESAVRQLVADQVTIRRLATVISLTADRKIVLAAGYGAASWIAENGAYPKVDDSYSTVTIGNNKLGKIILVSEELLNDSEFDLSALISNSFGRAFAEGEEAAFLTGTGTNQPTGVLTSGTAAVTAASSTAVASDELLDLYYALKEAYRPKATWLMSDAAEKLIRKVKDTTNQYIWQPGLTAGEPNTLLGRPVAKSDYMPAPTAGNKAIAFGDFSQYTIKDTVGMQMQVLDQLYAENGQVGYKGFERTDGKLVVPEAVQILTMKAGA